MKIETLVVGPLQVNCFIVACQATGEAMVIDPGEEGERILALLESEKLELKTVVNTHGHFDHIGANRTLVEKTGAELLIHEADLPLMSRAEAHAAVYGIATDASPEATRTLKDGDTVAVGELELEVIHLPGHSPGGIGLLCRGHLFCGDSLFADSVGRTDLPGGGSRDPRRGDPQPSSGPAGGDRCSSRPRSRHHHRPGEEDESVRGAVGRSGRIFDFEFWMLNWQGGQAQPDG